MTEVRMALIDPVEKQADGDLVRGMLAFASERIMEAEVEAETQWGIVADALRGKRPRPGALMDASRDDVLAGNGLRPFLPQTVHWTVCRLRRTGANSPVNTGPRLQAPTHRSG